MFGQRKDRFKMLFVLFLTGALLCTACEPDHSEEMESSAPAETASSVQEESETSISLEESESPKETESPKKIGSSLPTLKEFLWTALDPVGQTLYVYGGGWNLEDTGAGMESRTLGLSEKWKEFFDGQDASYDYLGDTYPKDGQNVGHELGLDCSGFVGWTLYNTFEKEDGLPGYVVKSSDLAYSLYEKDWGLFEEEPVREHLRPGDIISIKGHVWICLGTCGDGSILLVHSTPAESRTGMKGGGVCLSSIGGADSIAGKEARRVMREHYPTWYERYEAPDCSEAFLSCPEENVGLFRFWLEEDGTAEGLSPVLCDPDGFASFSGEEILKCRYE